MIRHYAAVLGERDPMLLSTLLRSRGTQPIYQIRIGTDTRAEADGLCRQLCAQGGACIVLLEPAAEKSCGCSPPKPAKRKRG